MGTTTKTAVYTRQFHINGEAIRVSFESARDPGEKIPEDFFQKSCEAELALKAEERWGPGRLVRVIRNRYRWIEQPQTSTINEGG